MRRPLVVVLSLLLVALTVTPVQALTIQRTWRASIGSDGYNGTSQLTAWTDGTGRLSINLKHMRARVTYAVQIRSGSCSNLGTILYRPSGVLTSSTGTASAYRSIGLNGMNTIWGKARAGSIAVRYVYGTSVRCGNLTFYKSTRIRIPYFGIDLPVVKGPSTYPYCNVGMWLTALYQPREPGVTYIFGHARTGMFLPLLTSWRNYGSARLLNKTIYVYTSDSRVHTYVVDRVWTTLSIQSVFGITAERLWVQTSTGPNFTYPKLILQAHRTSTARTTYAASHPAAHPVSC